MSLITDDQSLELLHTLTIIKNYESLFLARDASERRLVFPAAAACVGMPWWSSSPAPGAQPLQLFHGGAHKCRCKSRKFHQTIWFGSKNRLDGSRKNVVCLAVAKWSFHRWNFGVRVRSRIWVWVESLQTWMASDYTRPQLQVPRWILSEVSYLVVPGYIWKRVPWYPAVNSLPCSFSRTHIRPSGGCCRAQDSRGQCWDVGRVGSNLMGSMVYRWDIAIAWYN